MAIFSVFQIFSVITLCIFLIGLLNNLLTDKENGCEMTYMYEYPQFVRIKVPENNIFPQYGLYAYSEGRFTEKARKMRFDGIPVLFLPGNVGSHKQVRSLASVALRKAFPLTRYGFHFDFFTVDFNEELSGLFGGVLENQATFSSHCLKTILDLYQSNRGSNLKPESVIIIGHSMGGVVARSLLTYPQNKNIVNLIITLAAPHRWPIVTIDPYFKNFYDRIDNYWNLKLINSTNLAPIASHWKNKVFITIGGGLRDFLVSPPFITSTHSDITALTTAIPGVWLSTDHLCIIWCKQLVLVLNRLLFSVIDQNTKQLTTNSTHMINMGKHFLKIGHSKNYTLYNTPVEFIPDANWHEDSRRNYNFRHDKISKTWYYMIRLIDLPNNEAVTFQSVDLMDKEWLFGCQAKYVHGQHRVCMSGRHLSHFSRWGASRLGRRRIATLDLRALRASYPHWTHVLLRVSPINRPVEIQVDIHSKGSRQIQGSVPPLYGLSKKVLIKQTEKNALQYNITLPGLDMLYQAYLLHVEPVDECGLAKSHHATAELIIPWADGFESSHFFTETQKSPMKIRLMNGNPNIQKNSTHHVNVILTLDPQCSYQISISVSLYDVLGQFSRHYITSLPAYLAAILLLVLRHWAAVMGSKTKSSISFHAGLCSDFVKPYYILLSARLGSMFLIGLPIFQKMSSMLLIGGTPSQNFLVLPLLLFIIALGVAHILGAVCWGFIICSGQIAHRVLLRLVSFGRGGGSKFWEWVAKEVGNAPGFGGFLLFAIGIGSCGAASLVAGAVFYFFLLTKIYEDYLEDFVYKTIAKVAKKIGKINIDKSDDKKSEEEATTSKTEEIASKINEDIVDESKLVPVIEEVKDKNNKEESKEKDTKNKRKNPKIDSEAVLNSLHFHFCMFFIWAMVTILNIPTLLTWAHNFKYNKILETDPSFYPSIIMSASAFSLWQIDAPKYNIKYYNILDKVIYVTAVAVIMIAPMALYRLNYLLSAIFFIITAHQTFSFDQKTNNESDAKADDKDTTQSSESVANINTEDVGTDEIVLEKVEEIKTKLDAE